MTHHQVVYTKKDAIKGRKGLSWCCLCSFHLSRVEMQGSRKHLLLIHFVVSGQLVIWVCHLSPFSRCPGFLQIESGYSAKSQVSFLGARPLHYLQWQHSQLLHWQWSPSVFSGPSQDQAQDPVLAIVGFQIDLWNDWTHQWTKGETVCLPLGKCCSRKGIRVRKCGYSCNYSFGRKSSKTMKLSFRKFYFSLPWAPPFCFYFIHLHDVWHGSLHELKKNLSPITSLCI